MCVESEPVEKRPQSVFQFLYKNDDDLAVCVCLCMCMNVYCFVFVYSMYDMRVLCDTHYTMYSYTYFPYLLLFFFYFSIISHCT